MHTNKLIWPFYHKTQLISSRTPTNTHLIEHGYDDGEFLEFKTRTPLWIQPLVGAMCSRVLASGENNDCQTGVI